MNEVFIETISDTVFTALQTLSNAADREDSSEIVGNLITNLEKINTDLTTASSTLQSFSGMTSSAQQLLDTTASFLQQTQKQTKSNVEICVIMKKVLEYIEYSQAISYERFWVNEVHWKL